MSFIVFLIATVSIAIYVNKYDSTEKIKNNIAKIHNLLSLIIVPSLRIADISEVRRLMHMASSANETYLVLDNNGTIIMSDYGKNNFYKEIKTPGLVRKCIYRELNNLVIDNIKYLINCTRLINDDVLIKNKKLGTLISFKKYKTLQISSIYYSFVMTIVGLLFILVFLLRKVLHRQLLKPLMVLKNNILNISPYGVLNPAISEIQQLPQELVEIKEAFERLLSSFKTEYNARIEAEKTKALVDIMSRVCHDIRSPIASLELCISELKSHLPQEDVEILMEAIQSIRDISNNWLERYRSPNPQMQILTDENSKTAILLYTIIESVISQKRLEWKGSSTLIRLNVSSNSRGVWIEVIPQYIKSILSNILNNAYEALREKREIEIILNLVENDIQVIISDSGIGIPSESIPLVLDGFSTKHTGKGLGLSNAKQYIERLGGTLVIESQMKMGTQVICSLPTCKNPTWFPLEINISKDEAVILVDDDQSIHEFWLKEFTKVSVKLIQFYSGAEFLKWCQTVKNFDSYILFMDYELQEEKNGLDLLEMINPKQKGYLITSHAENITLQKIASELGVWLFPKFLIGDIAIKIL